MEVVATNLGKPTEVQWKQGTRNTGIFKTPVEGITLQKDGVHGDFIGNRKVHGGHLKACYLFASEAYAQWKEAYPKLEWHWGMFGENLTLSGLEEDKLFIGAEYQIGNALVRISYPREPCFMLGIKFSDQTIVEKFANSDRPGTYVEVLKDGEVVKGDSMKLISQPEVRVSTLDFYHLLFRKNTPLEILEKTLQLPNLPERKRKLLLKKKGA